MRDWTPLKKELQEWVNDSCTTGEFIRTTLPLNKEAPWGEGGGCLQTSVVVLF